ncbi:MAG: DivIVA domain-containing protein [Clostridia bacterium]|nr:DivIVA domain-containing protein [Clostridia bacterium]
MLSSADIGAVKFSKSMAGYKSDEVEAFIDKVQSDYEAFEYERKKYLDQIHQLKQEIESMKDSENTIHTVLLNAQRLADQIVDEARQKSKEILDDAQMNMEKIAQQERALSAAFQKKADERREEMEREFNDKVISFKTKAASMEEASQDAVNRQQLLFDRLKMEVAAFKNDITKRYREHLELLQKLPDEVPMDPQTVAKLVESAIDETPNIAKFIINPPLDEPEEPTAVEEATVEDPKGFNIEDLLEENSLDIQTPSTTDE